MSYEPFRGAAPPPVTSTSPPRQNTSPSRRGQVSQSYEEFRATGKSIELTDATDTRGRTGAPPQAQYGYTVSPYSGNQPPVRSPNYRIPGKSLWAKIRLFLRVLSVLASLTTGLLVGLVLKKYMETKHQRNTEELFWPKDLKLEPTYYMIVAACITILIHIGLIGSHFANRPFYYTEAFTKRDKIAMWLQFLIALIWIVGCALARIYASRGYGNRNDMWGWTCKASWHQHTVKVPFAQLCGQLSVAYYVAYTNIFIEICSILTYSLNAYFTKRSGYQGPAGAH